MKKTLLAAAIMATLGAASVSAAPINSLGTSETAIGAGTTEIYVEHQLSNNLKLGYQHADRDQYDGMDDIYGQFSFTDNLHGIIGHRSGLPFDDANFYAGLAASAPLTANLSGYASFIAGSDFNETQVGAIIALAPNLDFNVNYHSFNPDHFRSENKFGFGATVKF